MSEFPGEPDIEIHLPARAENVAVVRHALSGLADAIEIDADVMADINLAVSEACANVVVHAYDEPGGPLEVCASLVDEHVLVVVRDQGKGIVPRPDSPGLGVGLPLMATLSSSLELREGEDSQTEVWMTFPLRPEDEPAEQALPA